MAGERPEAPPEPDREARPAPPAGEEPGEPGAAASPPCFADEAPPDYMLARPMDRRELAGLLGRLLDAERRLADAVAELERTGRLPRTAAAWMKAEVAPVRARLSAQAARLGGSIGVLPTEGSARATAAAAAVADRTGDDHLPAALGALLRFVLGEIDRALPLVEDREVAALLEQIRAAHGRALAAAGPDDGRG